MADKLVVVTVRVPPELAERAKAMAARQDRTVQGVWARALRLGLDVAEEHERIACEAIKDAERRRQAGATDG